MTLRDKTVVRGEIEGDVPATWDGGETVALRVGEEAVARTFGREDLRLDKIADREVPRVNEGLIRIVRRSDKWLLALGVLVIGFTLHFTVWRWWLLLRSQDIHLSFFVCHKLTFLGMFFNNMVPGATGGDLVKALYVARRTHKRTEAVITVLVDRVTGIVALALIAAFALLFRLEQPEYRELALFVFGLLGALALGALVFFSHRVRRVLRVDDWAERLPGGQLLSRVDQAIFMYRYHKLTLLWAILLSFGSQLAIQFVVVLFAHAFHVTTRAGLPLPLADYLVVLPVGFIVSAVPIFPGGWGLRETAFAVAFHFVGVDRNPAVALSVMAGMMMALWSLLGGVYFLLGRGSGTDLAANVPPGSPGSVAPEAVRDGAGSEVP